MKYIIKGLDIEVFNSDGWPLYHEYYRMNDGSRLIVHRGGGLEVPELMGFRGMSEYDNDGIRISYKMFHL